MRLRTAAERLSTLARYLSAEAAFSGYLYRIRYDLDRQTYRVERLARTQNTLRFVPDPSPPSPPVTLPPDIVFADVVLPALGTVGSGEVFTHFYPHGYTDPVVIHLRSRKGHFYTVTVPPLTGEAKVYEGYLLP